MTNNIKSEKPTSTSYNATKTNTVANITNGELGGDPFCNNCKTSGKYTYRKYRNPRPMKHYRLSYNDAVDGTTYKQGHGANTVSSMERPGGLTRDTNVSYESSCNGCGNTTNTEWNQNNKCCDSKVHVTRSANTSIPKVKSKRVMSNRERLRERALTYKQNQTKNDNIENCACSSKKTTDQMSNKKYYVQGAVDSGTRMAQLKFNTFNTANKMTKHKFRGDYKERNENEQHHVIISRRNYNWGTNFCCPKPTNRFE